MIAFDWTNMTQAMWKSPLLPLLDVATLSDTSLPVASSDEIGSGARFKTDLLNYLKAYDTKRTICQPLIEQLYMHDFSEIRAALVASVPGRQGIEVDPDKTAWGWPGLKKVLSSIPVQGKEPKIVIQISSIASLGSTDKWLDKTFFKTLSISKNEKSKPDFKIIFPTADEIRRSLCGYDSGRAIHTKIQKGNQAKQLQYLKPLLCHWAGDGKGQAEREDHQDSGRKRAAPHVKTFIRFADASHSTIDVCNLNQASLQKLIWDLVDVSHLLKSVKAGLGRGDDRWRRCPDLQL
jgi:tyrosyl-DNA phosphodiesterase-1